MFHFLVLFLVLALASAHNGLTIKNGNDAACSSCMVMAEAKINVGLNEVLNKYTIETCGELCYHVPDDMKQHCDRVCFKKTLTLFMEVLNVTMPYIDPFAYCENVMEVCPKGNPDASATLAKATSTPSSGPAGTVFVTNMQLEVTEPLGLSEIHVYVTEASNGVSMNGASIFQYGGLAVGSYNIEFDIDTRVIPPTPVDEFPDNYYPGDYNVEFRMCQSMCGSPYEQSYPIDFGSSKVTFTVTSN